MSKNVVAKKDNTISLEGATKLVGLVNEGLQTVQKGYIAIAPHVAKLYDCKGFKALGYDNFEQMITFEFGMSHGTGVGLRKVFDLCGVVGKDNEYTIPGKYLDYGYTKLLQIAQRKKDFKDANINPFDIFTPDMTLKEMSAKLNEVLGIKAKEQEEKAIDTTAEDASAEATSAEATSAEATSAEAEDTPSIKVNRILVEVSNLKKEVSKGVDAKTLAYFDAIIANLKEVKKAIK